MAASSKTMITGAERQSKSMTATMTAMWRATSLLIREHGDQTEIVAAWRADKMFSQRDDDGRRAWMRIRQAIADRQAVAMRNPLAS
jgi:hypothetical protein